MSNKTTAGLSSMAKAVLRYRAGVKVGDALKLFNRYIWVPRERVHRLGTPCEKAGMTLLVKRGAVVLRHSESAEGLTRWEYRANITTPGDVELWHDFIEKTVRRLTRKRFGGPVGVGAWLPRGTA